MTKSSSQRRAGGGRRGRRNAASSSAETPSASTDVFGGRFQPLTDTDCAKIDSAVRKILSTVGLSEAPAVFVNAVTAAGGILTDDERLLFPNSLIDAALSGLTKSITLCGQQPALDLTVSGSRVYAGTGGAAPNVIDLESGLYRPSTLGDLYDVARLVDQLDNVHFFSRSVVARDMPTDALLDLNTAYASLAGTTKHVIASASHPDHVPAIAALCYTIAGSEQAFRGRPFLSLNINHVVPPLRFAPDACLVMAAAIRAGIPVMVNTFGQVGASSPVALAGSVVQTMAETLAGMICAWLIDPDAKAICGPRPMVTDLRTGAMSGGGGEQALATAMAVKMAQYYGLPNSTIAGATDSKIPDAQAGFEKALSITLAAQTGANLITQACGMQAGLMAACYEAYVIDNDMLGTVLRSAAPIDMIEDALSVAAIGAVVRGEGHFLGRTETYQRMKSDFLYPDLSDRRSFEEWQEAGAPDIRAAAKARAKELLARDYPRHIDDDLDQALRRQFDIRLDVPHRGAS